MHVVYFLTAFFSLFYEVRFVGLDRNFKRQKVPRKEKMFDRKIRPFHLKMSKYIQLSGRPLKFRMQSNFPESKCYWFIGRLGKTRFLQEVEWNSKLLIRANEAVIRRDVI